MSTPSCPTLPAWRWHGTSVTWHEPLNTVRFAVTLGRRSPAMRDSTEQPSPTAVAVDDRSILELYGLAVGMADRLGTRRVTASSFLWRQSALVTLRGVDGLNKRAVAAAGIVLAVARWLLLRRYGRLSRAKFAVILTLEDRPAVLLYGDEWRAPEEVRRRRRYTDLRVVERLVAIVLGVVFAAAAVAG